jgi:uncharacterized protein YjcR
MRWKGLAKMRVYKNAEDLGVGNSTIKDWRKYQKDIQ